MNKREVDLIKKYDTPETVCLITSYPDLDGESAERNAIANYSRELVGEMRKKVPIVVIAEIIDEPKIYEENEILVVRGFRRDSYSMNFQIIQNLEQFPLARQVILQFEFGVYGGSITTFLTSFLGLMIRAMGKHFSIMLHQVTDDLGELSEHLGISHQGLKTLICNIGMRRFYALTGLFSDQIFVHNTFLARKLSRYVKAKKIKVIPHGVGLASSKPTKIQARKTLNWKKDEFVVLVFGYLSWYKGSDWAISEIGQIAQKYPRKKIRLVLAGGESGTLKEMPHYQHFLENLYRLAERYNVEITGYIHDDDKANYFVGCDLVVLPHRVAMSESGVMAHVAMYKKPFIASIPRTTSLHSAELIEKVGFGWQKGGIEKKLIQIISDKSMRDYVVNQVEKQGRAHNWKNVATKYLVTLPKVSHELYTRAKYDTQVSV